MHGENWPALITNTDIYFEQIQHKNIPSFFNFLDVDILSRCLEKTGFSIQEINYFSRLDYPDEIRLDGREGVGAIAIKPCK